MLKKWKNVKMPQVALSDAEIEALINYLGRRKIHEGLAALTARPRLSSDYDKRTVTGFTVRLSSAIPCNCGADAAGAKVANDA